MTISKRHDNNYAYRRPSYPVDQNAVIAAGMVAFLTTVGGVITATTAPSGEVPIGTFWKDHALNYFRNTLETGTFDSNDQIALSKNNVRATGRIKITNSAGTVVYIENTDYSTNINNGVVTRIGAGAILSGASVIIWYEYTILASQINYQGGTNYDRLPDDTLGSGMVAVVEGWAHIFTDQFDPTQTYVLNAQLRSDALSRWTTAATAWSVCGRVISVPTVNDPWLGVQQITVTA